MIASDAMPTDTPAPEADPPPIDRKPAEAEWVDVMGGSSRWEIKVHDHGLAALVDVMPRLVPAGQTADAAIVQAARVSYGEGTKKVSEDTGLIRYLLRHWHTTPFEMVELKFHLAMPIFVARQWLRHRTASVNEYSGRYSVIRDRFYHPAPDYVRVQSATNRQGGGEVAEGATAQEFSDWLDRAEAQYADYERFVDQGVARETARLGLPASVYTEFYWKVDLHNLFHFLRLRMDAHAQREIRDYANAIFALTREVAPVACEAFVDYRLGAVQLTRLEVEAMRTGEPLASSNKRENAEWEEKRQALAAGGGADGPA